jgi:crotonobetainyl-CoA:carnitine CoA-transferase CaiB-like acyl-CoA transferase
MLAVMSALHHRDRTGEGQMIEIAQGELGVIGVTEAVIEHVWNGRNMGPQGNLHRVLAPHGIYQCGGDNQWIAIACGSDEEWTALAKTAGHAEWIDRDDFRTAAGRRAARLELDSLIGDWTISKESVALTEELQGAGVAAMTALGVFEMLADNQHSHRRDHFDLADEFPGDGILDGNPWHLSEASPKARTSAPEPGQHNEEVFGELLGLSSTEIHDLQAEGVIG